MSSKYTIFFIFFLSFVLLPSSIAFAEVSETIVTEIVNEFKNQSNVWYGIVLGATYDILRVIITLEIAWVCIQAAINRSDLGEIIKQLVLTIIAASFFLVVINNYQVWTELFERELGELAGQMSAIGVQVDSPFLVGLELFDSISSVEYDILEIGSKIIAGIVAIIVLICFTFVTAKMILIKCELYVASVAALILVAFGGSKFLREYAINTLRYVFSVVFKLFVMKLVIGVGFSFFTDIVNTKTGLSELGVILGFVIVLTLLCQSLPETVAGIINGSHVGNGAGLGSTASMVGGMAMGAVGGAMSIKNATEIAKAQGATGFGNVAKGALSAMVQARNQGQLSKTSMHLQLKDNLNTLRELNKGN